MIMITTAYGIRLTNNFGGFYKDFAPIYDLSEDLDLADSDWCAVCYSAEDPQLVIGFEIKVNGYS